MKTTKLNTLTKTLFLGILVTMMIFSFGSCAKKVYFAISPVVPAAQGKITFKSDKNNNYLIQIQISNLADVERLQPPKKSYVVWMETDRGLAINLGRISSLNNLSASFETVSTFRPTKIFITAEDDETTQYPGSMIVLTTDKF